MQIYSKCCKLGERDAAIHMRIVNLELSPAFSYLSILKVIYCIHQVSGPSLSNLAFTRLACLWLLFSWKIVWVALLVERLCPGIRSKSSHWFLLCFICKKKKVTLSKAWGGCSGVYVKLGTEEQASKASSKTYVITNKPAKGASVCSLLSYLT